MNNGCFCDTRPSLVFPYKGPQIPFCLWFHPFFILPSSMRPFLLLHSSSKPQFHVQSGTSGVIILYRSKKNVKFLKCEVISLAKSGGVDAATCQNMKRAFWFWLTEDAPTWYPPAASNNFICLFYFLSRMHLSTNDEWIVHNRLYSCSAFFPSASPNDTLFITVVNVRDRLSAPRSV